MNFGCMAGAPGNRARASIRSGDCESSRCAATTRPRKRLANLRSPEQLLPLRSRPSGGCKRKGEKGRERLQASTKHPIDLLKTYAERSEQAASLSAATFRTKSADLLGKSNLIFCESTLPSIKSTDESGYCARISTSTIQDRILRADLNLNNSR